MRKLSRRWKINNRWVRPAGLGSPAGGGFSPATLFAMGEQGYWLDPSDFSTMFQDAAGTTPVTAVGQSVRRMLDKSRRNNHFTQANTANAPILQVDSTGRHFLLFDGTDDWLQSAATINPGAVDKAQVFAGVRKLSDVTAGILLEASASVATNPGTFYLVTGPDPLPSDRYSTLGRGSASVDLDINARTTAGNAPDTAVLTATHDIAGDLSTIRRNGVLGINATGDKGAGNFLTYTHFIGRRNGASAPFNGRLYQLITRYGPNLAADQIAAAEAFVNQRTGAF